MQTDAGDAVMDETEIELCDVTQYLMPPPHGFTSRCVSQSLGGDYPQHDGVRPRTSGFPVARSLQ